MIAVILHGEVYGNSAPDEQDVLDEVKVVAESLAELGYKTVNLPFSLDIEKTVNSLNMIKPSFVFNLVESVEGKGRLIYLAPSILDHLSIPYTGSDTDAVYLTSGKIISKKLLSFSGLKTLPFLTAEDILEDRITFDGPYIIKAVWEHASIGLDEDSVIYDRKKLKNEIFRRIKETSLEYFAEAYIDGREFNVSLIGSKNKPEVLPVAEMKFTGWDSNKPRVVGYRAKWADDSFEYANTNRTFNHLPEDGELIRELGFISEKCWKLFGLSGYGRVDFRVDEHGTPWILEVNINPCLSPDGGFFASVKERGLDMCEAIKLIVNSINVKKGRF